MNGTWQLQDAKNRLSEVIELALNQGPQLITRRGRKTAVIISYREYAKTRKPTRTLSEFFRFSPLIDIELERDKSLPRDEGKL